jgi:hypothetical protein
MLRVSILYTLVAGGMLHSPMVAPDGSMQSSTAAAHVQAAFVTASSAT